MRSLSPLLAGAMTSLPRMLPTGSLTVLVEPERLRGRIEFKAESCEGCRICERVCPANAIRFAKTPDGMTFDCWHNTCVFCGNCEFYCPTDAIRQTTDWHMAHPVGQEFGMAIRETIAYVSCTGCNAKTLSSAPLPACRSSP